MSEEPKGKIFINYRRGDDPGFTTALYMHLEGEFGADRLFMDVEGHIKPGDNFDEVLAAQVAQCEVLLVIIGPRWADLLTARAGDRGDWVAIEIKAALDQGKRVIPVLVGGARFPRAENLSEAIRALARKNAVGLRPDRFKADCQGLTHALKEAFVAVEAERARTEAERQAAEEARRNREAEEAARAAELERAAKARTQAGLSPDEIRKAEELANWEFIKESANPDEFRDHLARFTGGTTERYARKKLEALVWAIPETRTSIEPLRKFTEEFPKGEHAAEAQAGLAALEKTAEAARFVEERRQAETTAWAKVAASVDIADIEAFLKEWPDGAYVKDARSRMMELRGGTRWGAWIAAGAAIAFPLALIAMFAIGGGGGRKQAGLIASGNAYYEKQDYDHAIADFTKAIDLAPDYAAYNNRGNAYYVRKDYDNAIADYTKAIDLAPNDAVAYHNRGNAYKAIGITSQSAADLDQARKLGYKE
ncbi:MAG: tetratricopeptide repeat protein [Rhodomicrobium sp.]